MLRGDFLVRLVFTSLKLNFNCGGGYSEGGQSASFPGGYWGLLGALTSFAYWGAWGGMQNAKCRMQNAKTLIPLTSP